MYNPNAHYLKVSIKGYLSQLEQFNNSGKVPEYSVHSHNPLTWVTFVQQMLNAQITRFKENRYQGLPTVGEKDFDIHAVEAAFNTVSKEIYQKYGSPTLVTQSANFEVDTPVASPVMQTVHAKNK
jgi:hypothetical protein